MFFGLLLVASLLGRQAWAQRPSNASLCDYYATSLYGANTTDNQFRLIQSILALAFAGGSGLANVSTELTGIFNPGTVVNPNGTTIPVDLQPWFNGSIDSTNLNNLPVGVNWLDAGGKAPLQAFLNGQTSSIVMSNTTNEYRLFNHWLGAFSHIFACSLPPTLPATTGGQLNLAYVHKFMDLNQTDIGHFIDQLALSSSHWGFSASDSSQLSIQLNAKYNVRCSPAVGTQLYSLCQDDTCPLAETPDCAAYANLGPSGVTASGSSAVATSSGVFTPSPVSSSLGSITAPASTSSAPTVSPSSTHAPSQPALTSGAIAGVAIGGAALVFIFVVVLVWLLRKKRVTIESFQPSPLNPSYATPAYSDPHTSYAGRSNQAVESWSPPPIHEMESPRFGSSPEMGQVNPLHQRVDNHSPAPRVENQSPSPYGNDNRSSNPYGNGRQGH